MGKLSKAVGRTPTKRRRADENYNDAIHAVLDSVEAVLADQLRINDELTLQLEHENDPALVDTLRVVENRVLQLRRRIADLTDQLLDTSSSSEDEPEPAPHSPPRRFFSHPSRSPSRSPSPAPPRPASTPRRFLVPRGGSKE